MRAVAPGEGSCCGFTSRSHPVSPGAGTTSNRQFFRRPGETPTPATATRGWQPEPRTLRDLLASLASGRARPRGGPKPKDRCALRTSKSSPRRGVTTSEQVSAHSAEPDASQDRQPRCPVVELFDRDEVDAAHVEGADIAGRLRERLKGESKTAVSCARGRTRSHRRQTTNVAPHRLQIRDSPALCARGLALFLNSKRGSEDLGGHQGAVVTCARASVEHLLYHSCRHRAPRRRCAGL